MLVTKIKNMPLRWQYRLGVMHAVEGDRMVPFDPGTFILWTRRGQKDVPANAGFASHDEVTCPDCLKLEAEPDPDILREDRDERQRLAREDNK